MKQEFCGLLLGLLIGFSIKTYLDNKKDINLCIKSLIKKDPAVKQ